MVHLMEEEEKACFLSRVDSRVFVAMCRLRFPRTFHMKAKDSKLVCFLSTTRTPQAKMVLEM